MWTSTDSWVGYRWEALGEQKCPIVPRTLYTKKNPKVGDFNNIKLTVKNLQFQSLVTSTITFNCSNKKVKGLAKEYIWLLHGHGQQGGDGQREGEQGLGG